MNRRSGKSSGKSTTKGSQPPRRKWLKLGGVSLLAAGVIVAVVVFFFSAPAPEPPPANLEGLSSAVRDVISVAQNDVRRQPYAGDAWGRLGMVLFAHRLESDARFCFRHASELDSGDFRWPYLLGVSLSVEEPRAAREQYERALELQPDSAVIRSRLAELELGLDQVEPAERRLREATELDPKNARAWLGLARIAFLQGDLEESRTLARKALRLAPDQRAPHAFLAMVLEALGEREQALEHLRTAQGLPDHTLLWQDKVAAEVLGFRQDTDAVVQQAEQLMGQNQAGQAAALLQRAIDAETRDPRPHVLLARLLVQNRQLDQAALVLDAATREFPDAASVHFQRGVVSFLQGRHASAAQQFRQAIQAKPNHALAHYNLGHSLLKLNDHAAALDAFRDAVRFQPDHADARINLGRLLIEQGENDAAREQLATAVELKPQDPEPRRLLEQLSAKP